MQCCEETANKTLCHPSTNHEHHEHVQNCYETQPDKHLHCVAHSYNLGNVLCCNSDKQEGIISHPCCHQEPISEHSELTNQRLCCKRKASWTEPRICRCGPYDPKNVKQYGCECSLGAFMVSEVPKEKPNKTLRFADEVVTSEDREKAFRNLQTVEVEHLCSCPNCAVIAGVGKRMRLYELPEPTVEDISVTHRNFRRQKIPSRDFPPWHANIKDKWRPMDVPSLYETTYQQDYKPPPISCYERKPVYPAPILKRIEPYQIPAGEYCSWKKTSTGKKRIFHDTCDECDKDIQSVHLHECNVAHLPPQYQCLQPSYHTTGDKFTLSDKGDTGETRYWQRTCCVPDKTQGDMRQGQGTRTRDKELPLDLREPVCPAYTSTYATYFKDPHRLPGEKYWILHSNLYKNRR